MHNHDQDLIAALAEGILDAAAAAAAAADIAGCPTCSADLAAQRVAIVSIAGASPVSMTSAESARLRSAVARAIGIEPTPNPVSAPRARRTPWGAIAIAAASLAAIVGVFPFIGLLSQGSDDSTAATTFAAVALDAAENGNTSQQREAGFGEGTDIPEEATLGAAAPTGTDIDGDVTDQVTTEAVATTVTTSSTQTLNEEAPAAALVLVGEDAIRDLYAAGPKEEYLDYGKQVDRADLACSGAAERELGNEPFYIDVPVTLDDGLAVVLYTDAGWTKLVAFDTTDCAVALVLP
jgi:anti-sigma factor RsiW